MKRERLINILTAAAAVAQETGAIDKALEKLPAFARIMIAPHLAKIDGEAVRRALDSVISSEFAAAVGERMQEDEG